MKAKRISDEGINRAFERGILQQLFTVYTVGASIDSQHDTIIEEHTTEYPHAELNIWNLR